MNDDLIKRSDAIEAVWKPQVKPNELIFDALKTAIESEINNVPSADRPQGEWIFTNDPLRSDDEWACSRCGNISFMRTNFCDRCGARMKGADDEAD